MLFIDVKFVNTVGVRLRNFKKKDDYLWNCSCPFCGDSTKNKLKARGYIYRIKSDLFYKCHNCGKGTTFGNLLKEVDITLYEDYVVERYKSGANKHKSHKDITEVIPEIKSTVLLTDDILSPLKRIDTLPITHPAVKYVINRKIPTEMWHLLYFCTKFKTFVNKITFKYMSLDNDIPRLIIPYFNNAGKCFAFQGRAFGNEEPRYITIKVDENEEKIYGLERIDFSKRIYVTEGPIDSLFIPNCIAVSGSSFNTPTVKSLLTNATLIVDNEPRSKELMKLMDKYIANGYSVCIWPETVKEKDINEMISNGKTPEQILNIINTNTFSGIEAKFRYNEWRKI